jgi:hypothetical protein
VLTTLFREFCSISQAAGIKPRFLTSQQERWSFLDILQSARNLFSSSRISPGKRVVLDCMSADLRRRSRVVLILFPEGAFSCSFTLSPSYVASARPRDEHANDRRRFISFGSTRGLGGRWKPFGCLARVRTLAWFHLRVNFVTSRRTFIIFDFRPHFLTTGTRGRIAPKLQPPMFRGLAGSLYSNSIP